MTCVIAFLRTARIRSTLSSSWQQASCMENCMSSHVECPPSLRLLTGLGVGPARHPSRCGPPATRRLITGITWVGWCTSCSRCWPACSALCHVQVFAVLGNLAHITKHATSAERARRLESSVAERNMVKDEGMVQQILRALSKQRAALPAAAEELAAAVAAYNDAVRAECEATGRVMPAAGLDDASNLPLEEWLRTMRGTVPITTWLPNPRLTVNGCPACAGAQRSGQKPRLRSTRRQSATWRDTTSSWPWTGASSMESTWRRSSGTFVPLRGARAHDKQLTPDTPPPPRQPSARRGVQTELPARREGTTPG